MRVPISRSAPRIACIQHGDFADARRRLVAGGEERYGGQRYTVETFERFVEAVPHLVVSLDAPPGVEQVGLGRLVGVGAPGPSWLPGRWRERRRAAAVIALLADFRPTHVLLRTNDVVGCRVLEWANALRLPTAALIASRFEAAHRRFHEFGALCNAPNVAFVANHNRVATESMLACGLRPEKALAWDYPPRATPAEFSPKTAPTAGEPTLTYAGMVIEAKGVADAVEAVARSRGAGRPLRLSVCGDGALRATLTAHPGVREGWLELPGNVASGEVLARMRESWAVVVPTRPAYPEALPLVITEALTTRTPILLSDHPVFRSYFREGVGVRFFRAADPGALAAVLAALQDDPAEYARLSATTEQAWRSLQIENRFHHVLERLARAWELPSSRGPLTG